MGRPRVISGRPETFQSSCSATSFLSVPSVKSVVSNSEFGLITSPAALDAGRCFLDQRRSEFQANGSRAQCGARLVAQLGFETGEFPVWDIGRIGNEEVRSLP